MVYNFQSDIPVIACLSFVVVSASQIGFAPADEGEKGRRTRKQYLLTRTGGFPCAHSYNCHDNLSQIVLSLLLQKMI
jgi:hypothetical protein